MRRFVVSLPEARDRTRELFSLIHASIDNQAEFSFVRVLDLIPFAPIEESHNNISKRGFFSIKGSTLSNTAEDECVSKFISDKLGSLQVVFLRTINLEYSTHGRALRVINVHTPIPIVFCEAEFIPGVSMRQEIVRFEYDQDHALTVSCRDAESSAVSLELVLTY